MWRRGMGAPSEPFAAASRTERHSDYGRTGETSFPFVLLLPRDQCDGISDTVATAHGTPAKTAGSSSATTSARSTSPSGDAVTAGIWA